MSVSIVWSPVPKTRTFEKGGTSADLQALADVFGVGDSHTPILLGRDHVPMLRAMDVASGYQRGGFYAAVADVIERVGEIRVEGEW